MASVVPVLIDPRLSSRASYSHSKPPDTSFARPAWTAMKDADSGDMPDGNAQRITPHRSVRSRGCGSTSPNFPHVAYRGRNR
jgi:hypothetical protein